MNAIITRPNALIDLNAAIAAECAKLGLPTPLRTRADLSDLPDFNVISCDDSGLPLAYLNTYHCSDCNQSRRTAGPAAWMTSAPAAALITALRPQHSAFLKPMWRSLNCCLKPFDWRRDMEQLWQITPIFTPLTLEKPFHGVRTAEVKLASKTLPPSCS